ncbi:MAG: hypothetical protein ACUZ8N_03465 [Candidatus Scalindua sp.]
MTDREKRKKPKDINILASNIVKKATDQKSSKQHTKKQAIKKPKKK